MKLEGFCAAIGVFGGFIASLFGGWDDALMTLIIFMGIDYLTGILVAGVFHKSNKTEKGSLESRAGFKGLCRKGMALLIVLIGARLDMAIGSNIIRDACVVGIITNELISIIENAGLMGVPVPAILVNSIEILKKKSEPTNTDAERDDSNVG